MPRLPGPDQVQQTRQPRAEPIRVPRPDVSGFRELGRLGEKMQRAAGVIQKRHDATMTTKAENSYVENLNAEWAKRQVEDNPARPDFATEFHSFAEQKARETVESLPPDVSEEAKEDLSLNLSSRIVTYQDKAFRTQLDAQRAESKNTISGTVNRIAINAHDAPQFVDRYIKEADRTVERYSGTLTPQDESEAKAKARNAIVESAVQGLERRGMYDDARAVLRLHTGIPAEGASDTVKTIYTQAEQEGVDPLVLAAIAKVESDFDPKAKAGTSTAAGLFQFTNATGSRMGLPSDARKASIEAQSRAAARLTAQNSARLEQELGRDPTPADLYLAHFLGSGDATRVLSSEPEALLRDVLPRRVLEANPFLKTWSVDELVGWAGEKMQDGMEAVAGSEIEGRDVAGDQAALPVDTVVRLHGRIDKAEAKARKEALKQQEELRGIRAPTKARPDVDPVGVLARHSEDAALASQTLTANLFADEQPGEESRSTVSRTEKVEQAGDELLEAQRLNGVQEGLVKLFSNDNASRIVRNLENASPDQAAGRFIGLKERLGKHWSRAYQELVEQGLPQGYVLMGVVSDSVTDSNAVAETLNTKEDDLRSNPGTLARRDENALLEQVEADIAPFMNVYQFGGDNRLQAERMVTAIRKVALSQYRKTGDAVAAREYAAGLIANRFETIVDDNFRMIVPRETGLRTGTVERALEQAQSRDRLKKFSPAMFDSGRADFLDREAVLENAIRQGVWISNEDGTGAVLMHQFPGGGAIPVKNKAGERYEVSFDDMPELAERRKVTSPRGPASPPTTFSGLTPDIARERMREQ